MLMFSADSTQQQVLKPTFHAILGGEDQNFLYSSFLFWSNLFKLWYQSKVQFITTTSSSPTTQDAQTLYLGCCTHVVMVSNLPYHVIIFLKLLVSPYCTHTRTRVRVRASQPTTQSSSLHHQAMNLASKTFKSNLKSTQNPLKTHHLSLNKSI